MNELTSSAINEFFDGGRLGGLGLGLDPIGPISEAKELAAMADEIMLEKKRARQKGRA